MITKHSNLIADELEKVMVKYHEADFFKGLHEFSNRVMCENIKPYFNEVYIKHLENAVKSKTKQLKTIKEFYYKEK